MKKVKLGELAFARSGDKGDVSNIGLMAKTKNIYEYLKKIITPEKVKEYFGSEVKGAVEIYPVDHLDSLEIILRQSLGGGATCTLRFDQTGKSRGPVLLGMEVQVTEEMLEEAKAADQAIVKQYAVT